MAVEPVELKETKEYLSVGILFTVNDSRKTARFSKMVQWQSIEA